MAAGSELSRLLIVDPLPDGGIRFEVVASAGERAALAARFDLASIDHLRAGGRVVAGPLPGSVAVEGRLEAKVTQSCVVTLEPVAAGLDETFRRLFAPDVQAPHEVEIDPVADDVEPLPGSRLDIGEIVAEELSLALDPYPRAPAVAAATTDPAGDAEPGGAFAVLARLHRD